MEVTGQRDPPPESLELPTPPTPQLQRSQSKSGDSALSGSALMPASHLHPDPVYIASSAALQIVNSEFVSRGPNWLDVGGADGEDALTVSPAALALVNAFLDHLLFSFLTSARSTSILSLKPAIIEVLKPRLAKDAIQGADEELKGYLAGGDDEELSDFHSGQELKGARNLHRIFRRTRLRCMVYTRLGDMEEEDEETYLEGEQLDTDDERNRLSRDLGNVSPAAAIFLTSIIEFIGEQTLMIVGEAAWNRLGIKKPGAEDQHPLVEEGDVEKLAFNTTLGRLWRSWRKRARGNSLLSPRPLSRDFQGRRTTSMSASDKASRTNSLNEVPEPEPSYFDDRARRKASVAEVLQKERDSTSVLPPQDSSLPEEPDFSTDSEASEVKVPWRERPRSMMEYSQISRESPGQSISQAAEDDGLEERLKPRRLRSSSLPAKPPTLVSPVNETFTTPSEGPDPFSNAVVGRADAEEELPSLTDDTSTVPQTAGTDTAVSTMYDGALLQGTDNVPSEASRSSREVSNLDYPDSGIETQDHALTPQALNFRRPLARAGDDSESRASTVSSEYKFHKGDPAAPSGIFAQDTIKEHKHAEDGAFPVDQPHGDANAGNEVEPTGSTGKFATLATMQGDRLRTYDESGKAVKRDIPVLYEAPSNKDVIYNPQAPTQNLQDEGAASTPTNAQYDANAIGQGLPPLTPLRELRDAAHDTSDEASSVATSYAASRNDDYVSSHRFKGSDGQSLAGSYSSLTASHSQPSVAASKLIDMRAQPLAVSTGAERAAVQRMSPSSASAREQAAPFGRTSTSSNRDGRPLTAGSSNSQVSSKIKGLIGRESGDLIRQPMPRRSSSENSGRLPNGSIKTFRSGDKNQEEEFENLIKSDETIQYTLTPQNMREMEAPDSPRWGTQQHFGANETPSSPHATPPPATENERPATARSIKSLRVLSGLRTNMSNGSNELPPGSKASPTNARAQPQPPPKSPKSPGGRSGAVPRDPTTRDHSLRDFADFIRSTGPDTDPKEMPKPVMTNKVVHSRPGSNGSQQNSLSGKPLPKKTPKHSPVVTPQKPDAILPSRTVSSKLKARDPTVPASNLTADLADFLRSEPPNGHTNGPLPSVHRSLSATQPTTAVNGRVRETIGSASSVASTQDSFAASKMTQSSSNSRTALLDTANRTPTQNTVKKHPPRNDEPPAPMRKQRRVRDPYAIPGDEDDEEYSFSLQPEREEESLSDFLRNYTPPTPVTTRTAPVSMGPTTEPPARQQKNSGPTMRERIARNIAVIPDYRPLPPKAPKKNPSKSPPLSDDKLHHHVSRKNSVSSNALSPQHSQRGRTNTAPQLPSITPRAASPHLVSQKGTKLDTYKPTRPTYAAHVDRQRPRAPLQARDEHGPLTGSGGGGGGMGDLADFLRETEPPAPSGPIGGGSNGVVEQGRPMSPGGGKERAFGRMLGRMKKVGS